MITPWGKLRLWRLGIATKLAGQFARLACSVFYYALRKQQRLLLKRMEIANDASTTYGVLVAAGSIDKASTIEAAKHDFKTGYYDSLREIEASQKLLNAINVKYSPYTPPIAQCAPPLPPRHLWGDYGPHTDALYAELTQYKGDPPVHYT